MNIVPFEDRDKDSLIQEIRSLISLIDSKDATIRDLRDLNSFFKELIFSLISSKSI